MRGGKDVQEKIYKTYKPYPVSLDADKVDYCQSDGNNEGDQSAGKDENDFINDFSELSGDPVPAELFLSKPITSNAENSFRPLRLLHSLYADRLNLLKKSLEELEEAKAERERLNKYALEELDPEIRRCEQSLSAIDGMLNNPPRYRDRRYHPAFRSGSAGSRSRRSNYSRDDRG